MKWVMDDEIEQNEQGGEGYGPQYPRRKSAMEEIMGGMAFFTRLVYEVGCQ